ncbi:uncharacterized protein LY79DRAFT_576758 [Colletotrichum navitas]|uniref:Uncharacterized protein n=1 Tax=Colletotrichum navitas TaxID=681940 RepID=A0AAD8Q8A7_9PEZI|nr:uncharacterized protein LY79DRAFT_576758 [Colletotrichum navitas]KAK1597489.1 hypothetical protein LY79DRAFT_576758 [Colletotrichum navitas]
MRRSRPQQPQDLYRSSWHNNHRKKRRLDISPSRAVGNILDFNNPAKCHLPNVWQFADQADLFRLYDAVFHSKKQPNFLKSCVSNHGSEAANNEHSHKRPGHSMGRVRGTSTPELGLRKPLPSPALCWRASRGLRISAAFINLRQGDVSGLST